MGRIKDTKENKQKLDRLDYTQNIVDTIRDVEHMTSNEEIAILRKTIAKILKQLNMADIEFDTYNQKIEQIKTDEKNKGVSEN